MATPKEAIRTLMTDGRVVTVLIAPSVPGTVVPSRYAYEEVMEVSLGEGMGEFTQDEDGFSLTIPHSRTGFRCHVPWAAVVGAHLSGAPERGMFWDLPKRARKLQIIK